MRRRHPSRSVAIGFLAALTAGGLALDWADRTWPPPLEKLEQRSSLLLDQRGAILGAIMTKDQKWRLPTQLIDIDEKYIRYLIAYEDQRFYSHVGIDGLAVLRALAQAIEQGRVVSGASTITMQVARMLEPMPRDAAAKSIQAVRAFQLERRLTKKEIIEAYVALAPFGGNIEGVRAASLAYFGKEPKRLTEAEAALLVALPRSPEATRPDRNSDAARAARDKVLRLLHARGLLSDETLAAAIAENVPDRRVPFPNLAPHLNARLMAQPSDRPVTMATSLSADLQQTVERVANRHLAALEPQATIAVLVVENTGRKVRAYLGSADPFSHLRAGGNDMVRAIRSPGSALKPLIYAMAFEDLIAHPETLMPDVAMRFGDYAPKNFDGFFRGEITAREALQASLNLPAVSLLDRIGPRRFQRRLSDSGVELELPPGAVPGLPMALGGVGINLEGLVRLYAALADGGKSMPLDFGAAPTGDRAPIEDGATVTSPLGAYYVTKILLDTPPPPNRLAAGNRTGASEIAYKTGTSYGFRDAWAIGYDRDYTIGVWVGRPDGSYSAGRMGRAAAAPILFEIFDLLPRAQAALPATAPEGYIAASNRELPANLQRFLAMGQKRDFREDQAPRILYPVDGTDIELPAGEDGLATLSLEAKGGQLPLRWLVNGEPVDAAPYRRQAEWKPDGRGAARVTVIDGKGRSASSEIWLQ